MTLPPGQPDPNSWRASQQPGYQGPPPQGYQSYGAQPPPQYPTVQQQQPAKKKGGAGKVIGLIVAFALTFVIGIAVGAAAQSGDKDNPQAGGTAPAGNNRPDSTDAPADPATTAPPKSTNPKFGETYTWKDGISVTIGAPVAYEKANQYVTQPEGTSGVAMTVTIVNKTGENYDPTFFYATMQSGNREAEQIFDSQGGLEGSPSTVLLPDREATFSIGFWAIDPADLVLEISPGFDYDKAVYTS